MTFKQTLTDMQTFINLNFKDLGLLFNNNIYSDSDTYQILLGLYIKKVISNSPRKFKSTLFSPEKQNSITIWCTTNNIESTSTQLILSTIRKMHRKFDFENDTFTSISDKNPQLNVTFLENVTQLDNCTKVSVGLVDNTLVCSKSTVKDGYSRISIETLLKLIVQHKNDTLFNTLQMHKPHFAYGGKLKQMFKSTYDPKIKLNTLYFYGKVTKMTVPEIDNMLVTYKLLNPSFELLMESIKPNTNISEVDNLPVFV